MKSSKWLLSLLVVILIMSFTITTVGANSELPPVGERDEDGDLVVDVLQPLKLENEAGLPDLDMLQAPGVEEMQPDLQPDVMDPPNPTYPADGTVIYEKYPVYGFTEVPGATRYQVEVYSTIPEPDVLVYKIRGTGGDCSCGCKLYPTLPLKVYDLNNKNGFYKWRVRAKVDGEWSAVWSVFDTFTVFKNGFKSSFNVPTKVWYPVYGTWVLTDAGFAKTPGDLYQLSSAINRFPFTTSFVYEVMMKRKNSDAENIVFFQAWPWDLLPNKLWRTGYFLTYMNDGHWALGKIVDGTIEGINSGTTTNIVPYGWNKITIMRTPTGIGLWINENYMGYYPDTTFTWGYVGFGMGKADDVRSPLLVDWARLKYTSVIPYP